MNYLDSRIIWKRLKSSAKRRGIPFELSIVDINNLSFPVTCPILGIPLKHNRGKPKDDSFSIDRIDSTLGYTPDNIQVISYRANRLKSDASMEELEKFYFTLKEL